VGLTWSAHISWLFGDQAFLDRVAAARRAGFRLVETTWPAPAEREGLPAALAEQGVGVALLNCDAGAVHRGERGFVNDPARREEARDAFAAAVGLAARVGAPAVNVLVGRSLPGVSAAAQRAALIGNLRAFAAEADAHGVGVVIEPLNEIENPGYLAPTPDAVVELIDACAPPAPIALLLDIYHVARAGGDPVAAIERHGERIGHIQLADVPGRGMPGTGSLDFATILAALDASVYDGAVGLEFEPHPERDPPLEGLLRDARLPVRA